MRDNKRERERERTERGRERDVLFARSSIGFGRTILHISTTPEYDNRDGFCRGCALGADDLGPPVHLKGASSLLFVDKQYFDLAGELGVPQMFC